MSIRSTWTGAEGAAFERVGLAFEALGFVKPRPDTDSDGAYASNIATQYRTDMTERQALAVVSWGLRSSRNVLNEMLSVYTLDDIEGLYGED